MSRPFIEFVHPDDRERTLAQNAQVRAGAHAQLVSELQAALRGVKTLREILSIGAYCKKIRGDENDWHSVESYISRHTTTQFSHGICPSLPGDRVRGAVRGVRARLATTQLGGYRRYHSRRVLRRAMTAAIGTTTPRSSHDAGGTATYTKAACGLRCPLASSA